LISPIPFDKWLQKCYNIDLLSDVVYKRITEKASYRKIGRAKRETLWSKGNVARLSIGEPILSERIGFF
ncbi:unnamed protein product, partial [marine sediment metagenome]